MVGSTQYGIRRIKLSFSENLLRLQFNEKFQINVIDITKKAENKTNSKIIFIYQKICAVKPSPLILNNVISINSKFSKLL